MLRFTLRFLLVVVTVMAVALAYVGNRWHRVKQQRLIVAQIEAAGGLPSYDYQFLTEANLNYTLDAKQSPGWINRISIDDPAALRSRYRQDATGQTIEEQVETPPGPWLIRRALGNDTFSYVETVSFAWTEEPGKLDPHILLQLPRLKVVVLRGDQVSDEWLMCVAQLPDLRGLALYGDSQGTATAAGIAQLRRAKHLEALSLSGEWLTDANLSGVRELKHLRSIEIGMAPNVTSAMFTNFDDLTALNQLVVSRAEGVDDQHTHHLRRLKNLRALWLQGTSITDASVAHIAELKQLEWLDLAETEVGDPGVEQLAASTTLIRLNLRNTKVADAGARALARLPRLEHLELGGAAITDASLPAIAEMTTLETLELWPTAISDDGLLPLTELQNLRRLSIGPHITKEAANKLRKMLPSCEVTRLDAKGSGTSMLE
jgi:hypothetical protein